MKLIRKHPAPAATADRPISRLTWKVLVVDDEPDVRQLTELNLRGFTFAGRGLEFVHAGSASEARARLVEHPDIAVALVDVVMETDDAGLQLVHTIREELGNALMRIIIRTGQPGMAPERYVIDHYDIDDYKDKTELTAQKLYTALRATLKSYRDLHSIELNRIGLEQVLASTPQFYELRQATLEGFFEGVLLQIIALCRLTHTGLISSLDGLLTTRDGDTFTIRAGAGDLAPAIVAPERLSNILQYCAKAVLSDELPQELRAGAIVVPLRHERRLLGFVYLESDGTLNEADHALIQIMADQSAAALENFGLHNSLRQAYENTVEMLALLAEYKDKATGMHIRRIGEYTRQLALALGQSPAAAEEYGRAARLHDVGKVGIPDHILQKQGPLTIDEFALIRTHTTIGRAILDKEPSLAQAREVAHHHHERWNGTGYPDGLSGTDIPLVCRIVAVADVFDALLSRRPYKHPWPEDQAIAEIRNGAGSSFDPDVVDALVRIHARGDLDELIGTITR